MEQLFVVNNCNKITTNNLDFSWLIHQYFQRSKETKMSIVNYRYIHVNRGREMKLLEMGDRIQ